MSKYLNGPSKLNFKKLLKSSGPLFILGIFKAIISEKFKIGANEYGKHWNFFLNLAIFPFLLLFTFYPQFILFQLFVYLGCRVKKSYYAIVFKIHVIITLN